MDLEGSFPRRNSCQVFLNLPEDSLKDAEDLEYSQIYERFTKLPNTISALKLSRA